MPDNIRINAEDLRKLDTLIKPNEGEEVVTLSVEHLLVSIALSAKRIADVLEDGLIHLDHEGKVSGLADLAAGGLSNGKS